MLNIKLLSDNLGFEEEESMILLELFTESLEVSLANIEDALDMNDFKKIASEAHSIKGSAANLLLADIVDIAKQLEIDARSKNRSAILNLTKKIEYLVEKLNEVEFEYV